MIKDYLTKKALAVVCAVSLSVGSVAVAFATSGGFGMDGAAPSASASASAGQEESSSQQESSSQEESSSQQESSSQEESSSQQESSSQEESSSKEESSSQEESSSNTASEKPTDPIETNTYKIIGDLVGTWDFANALVMTKSKDDANIYTATVVGVKAGQAKTKYDYKVVMNDNWDTQLVIGEGFKPSSQGNFNLADKVKEDCDITITLNIKDFTVKTSLDGDEPVKRTDISAATVTLEKANTTYNGTVQAPVVSKVTLGAAELKAGVDYKVSEITPSKAGTYTVSVEGMGDYEGTATAEYVIAKRSVSKATASVGSKTYTGKTLKSTSYSLKMKLNGKTTTLKKDTDYTVKAASRASVGSSKVTFTGKGNFTGTVTANFVVKAKSIKSAKISVSSSVTYTGKSVKATVKVKDGSKTLKANKDYTLKFSNNKKIGKATVEIKGKGNYSSSVKKTFKIVPGKASIKKVVNVKGKKVKVTIKSVKGATSYKVSYRIKGAKKWSSVTTKKTSVVLSKLKKNKTYQIKVAAAAKSGKTTYTGAESKTKSVKVKK